MTNPSRGELVPGGLALVIGSIHKDSPFIGSIVELIEGFDGEFGKTWRHFPLSSGSFLALEVHLIPINPEPDPLHIEEQQEQSA